MTVMRLALNSVPDFAHALAFIQLSYGALTL